MRIFKHTLYTFDFLIFRCPQRIVRYHETLFAADEFIENRHLKESREETEDSLDSTAYTTTDE